MKRLFSFCLRSMVVVMCILAPFAASAGPTQVSSEKSSTMTAYEQAQKNSFDRQKFANWLRRLPRDGERYVVEGDMLVTEQEALVYLVASSSTETRKGIRPELLVNVHEGQPDYYAELSARTLRYAIERTSFSTQEQFDQVAENFRKAASDWESACSECQIKFVRITEGGTDAPNFRIRYHDAKGSYIAASFFPHDVAEQRVLNVDPSYFATSYDRIGVFRHEIGHVLGYRHEHTRGVNGCYFEDNQWLPLTPYDPTSVMHYFCGGGGNLTLQLTKVDQAGHRLLYGSKEVAQPAIARSASSTAALTNPPPAPPAYHMPGAAEAYRRAIKSPFDAEAIKEFLSLLPYDGKFYIVEGDIRMTEQEVREYLVSHSAAPAPGGVRPELLVNVADGQLDYYSNVSDRTLTYAVDRASFKDLESYRLVSSNFGAAAKDWENSCRQCSVRFVHVEEQDTAAERTTNFVIRSFDSKRAFIAASFFPHDDPSRRVVDVDPTYFGTSFDKVGVFRHEIGHILGYRHEHIRGIAGCNSEGGKWVPMTPYDPKSVMHYFCGGGGSMQLALTQVDRAGHKRLYGGPASSALLQIPILFYEGNVVENLTHTLAELAKRNVITVEPAAIGNILDAEKILLNESETHLELDTALTAAIVAEFNPSLASGAPQSVKIPQVKIRPLTNTVRLDAGANTEQSSAGWRNNQTAQIAAEKRTTNGNDDLRVRMYELDLVLSEEDYKSVEAFLKESVGKQALVSFPVSDKGTVFSTPFALPGPADRVKVDDFWKACRAAQNDDKRISAPFQGDIGQIVGLNLSEDQRKKLNNCVSNSEDPVCPGIALVDTPVALHPDIKDAVIQGGQDDYKESLVANGKQRVDIVDTDHLPSDADHGTHLAGLIAAQDNGFGVVGVNPGAHLFPLVWGDFKDQHLGLFKQMNQFAKELPSGSPIYVFASEWDWQESDPSKRLRTDAIALGLDHLKPLWVVAAGENKTGGQGTKIDSSYGKGPMSLGALDNVIVVTGYVDSPQGPTVPPDANYGQVHLAAPYFPMPSTMSLGRYVRAGGTSQASALVAGVASVMLTLYPKMQVPTIKMRLMVTSTPSTADETFSKVISGILNADLATRSPYKHLLQRVGGPYTEFKPDHWCNEWNLLDPVTSASLGMRQQDQVLRLYKRSAQTPTWVVYTLDASGGFERYGPGVLNVPDDSKVLMLKDGTFLTPSQISDVVLFDNIPVRPCQ